ncbi:LysR substrate-binding domain-containing protein [Actinomycetospora sp. TBRC 11914]|uniref:LysR family transcriptional regulator n=1 Tax=Actinomycetospora sp. TBRC 11914 TaxID=2729387 RepID=UPI00145C5BB4|nr:LysR substrate-binding domain-containing protein [Actinomycetospora sp. TBRC 11914]NMO93065.1 LysR family transcriptional regulator [Actinomycetospora sp. TBRC 11914]
MELRVLRYFVAVAEERHVGRAAARLHMTQPPLSRAVHRLETDLGTALLVRTPAGVELTAAGQGLYDDARSLLDHADRVEVRARSRAGRATLAVGSLADAAELVGGRLVSAFRARHPDVSVRVHEADLGDPSAGLRAGLVDVALTRLPFTDDGLRCRVLHSEPVGLVVRDDDPLAAQPSVRLAELPDRRWVRLPPDTDPVWTAYWTAGTRGDRDDAPMRTIQECLQAVLWDGRSALAPLDQLTPAGLVIVPVADRPPSRLVLAWPATEPSPLVRSFVRIAAEAYHRPG